MDRPSDPPRANLELLLNAIDDGQPCDDIVSGLCV